MKTEINEFNTTSNMPNEFSDIIQETEDKLNKIGLTLTEFHAKVIKANDQKDNASPLGFICGSIGGVKGCIFW